MDEKLAALYDSFIAGGTKMSASKEDFITKVKTDKSYASIVAKNLQSVGKNIDDYTEGKHARDWNEDNADAIKSEKERQEVVNTADETLAIDNSNISGIQPQIMGGVNTSMPAIQQAQQKPQVQQKVTPRSKEVKFENERQVGLQPPEKIEAPVNWGETEYLEGTKIDLPNEIAANQLDIANKAIQHTVSQQYGEDVWQGNTPTAKRINAARLPLIEQAAKGELSEAQLSLLGKVSKDNPKSNLLVDVATNGDPEEIQQLAINNDEDFAKNTYNERDKLALAELRGVASGNLTPQDRMQYWYEKTKGLSKIDMPETIPYQLIANDSKNLQEQLGLIGGLFEKETGEKPETTEQAVAAIPKSFDTDFTNPQEKLYAYYQILGNRFQELTREIQKEYPNTPQQEAINLKDRKEGIEAIVGTMLPFLGVEHFKDPKYVEYMRVLNKIHALAPLVQKGQAGKAYGELGDEALVGDIESQRLQSTTNEVGKFAASMWNGVSDMMGYDVLKKNQEFIAQEQQQALSQTGGKITPAQQQVLDERMSMKGFMNPKSWGQAASSLVGMGVIMSSNPFAGELQAAGKGLQMLNKGSKLFNSEQKLTRLGKIVQGAVGITAAGLETEIAGQVSGEGESVTDELSFGMGAVGEAGKLALGGLIGLIGKGVTKVTPNALIAQVEKQYGKLSPEARKSIGNVATNVGNRVSSGLSKEVPEEIAQTAYENYKKYGLDGMMQQTIKDVMGENPNWNEATRWVAQIALMGALDGQPDTDHYKLQTWATTMAEKFSGQKVDADLLNEFSEQLRKETENVPTGVKFKDGGIGFTLNNTKFDYNAETGELNHEGAISTDEATKAQAVAETLSSGVKAANEGNFTPLFGEDAQIANKQNEETAVSQQQEIPAQEIGAQTPEGQVIQETPAIKAAEVAQETPEVEAAEIAPTAEQLDAESTEKKATLAEYDNRAQTLTQEISALENQIVVGGKNTPIYQQIAEKEQEKAAIEKESTALADRVVEIASLRQTVKTKDETIEQRKQEIDTKLQENEAKGIEIAAQHAEAIKNRDFAAAEQLDVDAENLVAEKESLNKELEALQPKKVVEENLVTEKPTNKESLTVEKPTKAETEKDISEFSDENKSYRVVVGDEAFNDIVESGVVRTNATNKGKNESGGISLTNRPTAFPSFSKGKASVEYAASNPNNYIIVTNDKSIQPSKVGRHGKGTTFFPTDDKGNHLKELDAKKVSVYKHVGEGKYELVYENGKVVESKKAETPQLEKPIVESKKKESEPIQKEVVEKLPEVTDIKESVTPKNKLSKDGATKAKAELKKGFDKITKRLREIRLEQDDAVLGAGKYKTLTKKQSDEAEEALKREAKDLMQQQTALQKELKIIEVQESGILELFDHYETQHGSTNTIYYDFTADKLYERENVTRGRQGEITIERAAKQKFIKTNGIKTQKEFNEKYTDSEKEKYEKLITDEIDKYRIKTPEKVAEKNPEPETPITAKKPHFTEFEENYNKLQDKKLSLGEKREIATKMRIIAEENGMTDIVKNIKDINAQLEKAGLITKEGNCP